MDLASLGALPVRFSQLVAAQPWIAEIEIYPLLASADRLLALDARAVLHPSSTNESELPSLAIRPYPTRCITPWKLRDGTHVTIRPIRPKDEPLMVQFHQVLSKRSVYLRYFTAMKLERISATMLPDNRERQHLARKAGFTVEQTPGTTDCRAELILRAN